MRVFIKWSYSVIKSNTDSGAEIRAIVKAILEINLNDLLFIIYINRH
jgi:hypothetical protein